MASVEDNRVSKIFENLRKNDIDLQNCSQVLEKLFLLAIEESEGSIYTYFKSVSTRIRVNSSPPVLRSERSEASVAARGGGYQVKTGTRHRSDISGCKTIFVMTKGTAS